MSNKQTLTPKLRFPEFRKESKAWTESTLEDISPAIFDGTHQTPTYTNEGVPFFSVENVVSGAPNKFIWVRSTPCALNPRIFINFADRIGLS